MELDLGNGLALRVTFLFAIHESDKIGLEKAKFGKEFLLLVSQNFPAFNPRHKVCFEKRHA